MTGRWHMLMAALMLLAGCQNFHVVEEGRIYRSAQLDGEELTGVVETHGIRTVINLRGAKDADWYREELAVCRRLGVRHEDIRWSAQRLPMAIEVLALVKALHEVPRPILIHCLAGADRTGLASVVALLVDGQPLDLADDQLSLVPYGHLPLFGYRQLDAFLERYRRYAHWLPFEVWLRQVYAAEVGL